jgi:hypothetical protein
MTITHFDYARYDFSRFDRCPEPSGVQVADFTTIFNDCKQPVTRAAVTIVIDNISGGEERTYATATTIDCIFTKEKNNYLWKETGIAQTAHAILLYPTTTTINRYDRITVDSEVYLVENTTLRKFGTYNMFNSAVLFKES